MHNVRKTDRQTDTAANTQRARARSVFIHVDSAVEYVRFFHTLGIFGPPFPVPFWEPGNADILQLGLQWPQSTPTKEPEVL